MTSAHTVTNINLWFPRSFCASVAWVREERFLVGKIFGVCKSVQRHVAFFVELNCLNPAWDIATIFWDGYWTEWDQYFPRMDQTTYRCTCSLKSWKVLLLWLYFKFCDSKAHLCQQNVHATKAKTLLSHFHRSSAIIFVQMTMEKVST